MRLPLLVTTLLGTGAVALAASQQEPHPGRQVFDTVCATCHSMDPPPRTAPPMRHVVRHYREAIPDSAAAVERIAAWIVAPDAERSLLPAMARERFGAMPPFLLPEGDRRAVAAYVLSLDDGAASGPGPTGSGARGMGRMKGDTATMRGMGRRLRHGAPPDTTRPGNTLRPR